MKKTENIPKTSFKGLIDLQSQKLPEKKSRSRSIRDRNNTTSNNFSHSRATEHQQSRINQQQTRARQVTWAAGSNQNDNVGRKQSEENVKFDDNLESNMSRESGNESRTKDNLSRNNESRNEGSMEKIRENMRKQSEELKEKIRERSHSRRRRNNSNSRMSQEGKIASRQNSRQAHRGQQTHNQEQQVEQEEVANKIQNMKNKVSSLEYHYGRFGKEVYIQSKQKQNVNTNGNREVGREEQLREKAEGLNNMIETFDITFRENIAKVQQDFTYRIDVIRNSQLNRIDREQSVINQSSSDQAVLSLIHKLQTQFLIQDPPTRNSIPSTKSIFTQAKQDPRLNFSDLEKRLLLAEQRLLK